MKVQYFDKPFTLIAIADLSELGKNDQEAVAEYLNKKYEAWNITYPSDSVKESIEEVSKKGFLKFREKPPYTLTTDEAVVLFLRCLDKFNPMAVMRTTPNTLRIQKNIANEKDFTRIVDELTLQQDNITLAHFWSLPDRPRIAYTTKSHPLNSRISRTVIPMDGEYIGKRKFIDKMTNLDALIDEAVQSDMVLTKAAQTEAKYRQ